jgi:hypothetical protein
MKIFTPCIIKALIILFLYIYEAKHRIITNDSLQYAEWVIQVMSLFGELSGINVRSSTATFSYITLSSAVVSRSWHIWLSCDTKLPGAPNAYPGRGRDSFNFHLSEGIFGENRMSCVR